MSGSTSLPIIMTSDGPIPRSPADLNAALIAEATALSPGLTTNLPGTLIEDISSTDTGALVVIDQTCVDLINSVTPRGANAFILNQLGQIYGVAVGGASNTSVLVVFTGPVGYVIAKGFVVSDGTLQYTVSTGGVIGTGGTSASLLAVATQTGSFAVPAGTVTRIITSVPATINLSVTNPLAGTPGASSETEESYRARVLTAGLVTAQGTISALKTLLTNVPGVQSRLVSVRQQSSGGWEVIVGGSGDPYQIGYAIYQAIFDISSLVSSVIRVTSITNTNPAVITTDLNHGFTNGQNAVIQGAQGMPSINSSGGYTITVTGQNQFTIPFNATSAGTYTGGGFVTPNFRNQTVSIYDYPDTYSIVYVIPPSQAVSMVVTWNTSSPNFISSTAVAAAAQPAISDYVNALPVGQPINLFQLQETFVEAVSSLVDRALLTRMIFNVSINGIGVAPQTGTGIIAGDPESYFTTSPSAIVVNQG